MISKVGFRTSVVEACAAFTHVTACLLAESPKRPLTPEASAALLPPLPLRLLLAGATVARGVCLPLKNYTYHGALVVTLYPLHDDVFTRMTVEGFTSQLAKLDRRFQIQQQ